MKRLALLLLLPLLGCPEGTSGDDDDSTAEVTNWTLQVVNSASNTMDYLGRRSCAADAADPYTEMALPPDGLLPGEFERYGLPTPSCFALHFEGEGCFADLETGPIELQEQVTVTLTDDDLICAGG
jgi:hypothetical protein